MKFKHFEVKNADVVIDLVDDATGVFMIRDKNGAMLASINLAKTGTHVNIDGVWDVVK